MGLIAGRLRSGRREYAPPADGHAGEPRRVIWHELECGGYEADLPLWRELAAQAASSAASSGGTGAILDVGAGTGRVALDLCSLGHDVTAVDVDPQLVDAMRRRAGAERLNRPLGTGRITPVCADARRLALPDGAGPLGDACFALSIVAMQSIHLFGGSAGRAALLRGVRGHLAPGGLLACAIVADQDTFDTAAGDFGPPADRMRVGAVEYASRAVRVGLGAQAITIERVREVCSPGPAVARERDVVTLDRFDGATLAEEAQAAGLRALGARSVPATRDHLGATVVMLGV